MNRYWYNVSWKLRPWGLPRIVTVEVTDADDPTMPTTLLYGLAFSFEQARVVGIKMVQEFEERHG